MADTTAQRWMRLMGGQGRPTARPPSDADVADNVARYPERAAQALVDQSRALGQAASARQARGWIRGLYRIVPAPSGQGQPFEPRYQVLLRAIPLHAVTVSAEQLEIVDVVRTAARLWDHVVNLEVAEFERRRAACTTAFLLAEQHVLVLPVVPRSLNVVSPRDVVSRGDESVVKQISDGLLQADVDQFGGLRRDIDPDPIAVQQLGRDARRRAATEWIEH